MVGRFFARAMMVIIMAVTVWLANLTWQSGLTLGQKTILMMIESTIFISNLSLLIQSIMSFGAISVREDSFLYFLGGYEFLSESFGATQLNAHYCFLSWARSLALTLSAVVIFFVSTVSYLTVLALITFLSNPHLPTFSLKELAVFLGSMGLAVTYVSAMMKIFILFYEKLLNRNIVVRWILLSLCGSVFFGLLLGSVVFFVSGPELEGLNWLNTVMLVTGVAIALISFVGAVVGLSYCVMQLVKDASERYSILGKVWNTLCPVQTINIVR
ncbi:MAG: hypothetical protein HYT62_03750 [Candidatus Yanofskybacteria bacterium]|nr:hypothetical protein [Candidatus Yanofskybacteria bacterium]